MSKESAVQMLAAIPSTQPIANGVVPPTIQTEAPKESNTELTSTRFAHIAKKEAELVKQREAFKKEQQTFLSEREKLVAGNKRIEEFEATKAKDPIAAMKLAGFTDTDIINYYASLEDTSTPEEKAVKATQAEIKKFQDQQAKERSEEQQKRNDQILSKFKSDISQHLSSDTEKYKYCNFEGPAAESLLYEMVNESLSLELETNPDAKPISIEEAAEWVEKYYRERDELMGKAVKRTPVEAVQEAKQQVEQLKAEVSPGQPGKSRTLSSKAVATSSSALASRKETPSEKRQRLITMLGNLGKK